MNGLSAKGVRRVGWLLLVLYVVLAGIGMMLQFATDSHPFGSGPPTINVLLLLLATFVTAIVGGLLISRRPRNPIGWTFSLSAVLSAMDHFTYGYATYGAIVHPGSLPGAQLAALWWHWTGRTLGLISFIILFTLFPDGQPLTPRWGKVIWIGAGTAVAYILSATIAPLPPILNNIPFVPAFEGISSGATALALPVTWLTYATMLLCAVASLVSMVLRFFRASGVERQQFKWFAFTGVIFIPTILLLLAGIIFMGDPAALGGTLLALLFQAALAVSSAIAILRYRLWDIDIIIRRTLIYTLLTAGLALVYFSSVALLQHALQLIAGPQGMQDWAIVLSTLITIILVSPLRRRIQRFIDHRFFRRKIDAEQTLARFAAVARDEIDLDQLAAELLHRVQETLQPEYLSLWLRKKS